MVAIARLIAALIFSLSTAPVWPLGLGELEVRSRLNQPLDASIRLLDASADEVESLKIQVAVPEAYDAAGLDRPDFLRTVRFDVRAQGSTPYVAVSSSDAAREPVLNLYVDARWSEGRLLREYALLLDPPPVEGDVPAAAAAPPVIAAASPQDDTFFETAAEAQRREPPPELLDRFGSLDASPASPPAARPATPPPAPAAGNGPLPERYGPVQSGETLWRVAYKLRPDASISMDQMQVALYEANPDAFDDGRLTGLMAGAMLQVPTVAEIRAIDPVRAHDLVSAARGAGASTAPVIARPAPRPKPAPPPAPAVEPEPEPAPEPEPEPLPAEPAAGRGSALAELQREFSQSQEPEPEPVDEFDRPLEAVPQEAPQTLPEAEPAVDEPELEVAPPRRRAPPPRDEEIPTLWLVAFGLIGLLLLLGIAQFLLRRRAKPKQAPKVPAKRAAATAAAAAAPASAAAEEPESSPEAPDVAEDAPSDDAERLATLEESLMELDVDTAEDAPADGTTEMPALEDTLLDDDRQAFDETVQMPAMDPDAARRQSSGVDFDVTSQFEAETMRIDLDSNDPVAEADFHIAYGLYDEAALLLRQAAEQSPERTDIRQKLAETYFAANKPVEFLETAEGLQGQLDEADWQKIVIMGQQLTPDAQLFSADGAATQAAAEPALDFEFEDAPEAPAEAELPTIEDVRFEESPPEPAPEAPVQTAENEEVLLDFKLEDFELDVGAENPPADAAPAPAPEDDNAVDFDLSDFDVGSLGPDSEPAAAPESESPESPAADEMPLGELDLSGFDADSDGPIELVPLEDEAAPDGATALDADPDSPAESETPAVGDGVEWPDEAASTAFEPEPEGEPESPLADTAEPAPTLPPAASEEPLLSFDDFAEGETLDAPPADPAMATDTPPDEAPPPDAPFDDFDAVAGESLDLSPEEGDEAGTKLDLARAYVDIGDSDMARTLLQEVIDSGTPAQAESARELLTQI